MRDSCDEPVFPRSRALLRARNPTPTTPPNPAVSARASPSDRFPPALHVCRSGEPLDPPVDVPMDITTKQMETLLNNLLSNEEAMNFSFFIDGEQIAADLAKHLKDFKVIRT